MLRSWLARSLFCLPFLAFLAIPAQAQQCASGACSVQACPAACATCPSMVGPVYSRMSRGFFGKMCGKFASVGNMFYGGYCPGSAANCGTYVFCTPQPPNLAFPTVCGKGVCDPCTWDHFGYHNTCWAPWGFPPSLGHCPTPQLAAVVPSYTPRVEYFSSDLRDQQPGLPAQTAPPVQQELPPPAPRMSSMPVGPGTGYSPLPQAPRQFSTPISVDLHR